MKFAHFAAAVACFTLAACGGGGGGAEPSEPIAASLPATSGYSEVLAGDEPYMLRCDPQADSIILYLHTWSSDLKQVLSMYPAGIAGACVVAPNFNGPNWNPNALGTDDTITRMDRAVQDAKARTGLDKVDVIAASGGTLAAMNYMSRHAVRSASLWLPIYGLESLYRTTQDESLRTDMKAAIGHEPAEGDSDYLARSPASRLDGIGKVKVYMNVAAEDTTSPPAQGEAAQAHMERRGVKVTYRVLQMGHVFDQAQREEAVRQIKP